MESKEFREKHWVGCEVEREHLGEERKTSKENRKRKQAKDRSKYKKTNQQQLKKSEASQEKILSNINHLKGKVIAIHSVGISVACENDVYLCSLRGSLKKEKTQFKNLIVVGDDVLFEIINDNEGAIVSIESRSSILSRADNLSRRKEQLIAANIDQVLITVSVVIPPLKPFLIDRYIIAAKKGNMTPIIVINKIDLLDKTSEDPFVLQEIELYNEFINAYSSTGLTILSLSAERPETLEDLRSIMKDKSSVFSGQSGVGKSTLINKITGSTLKIGEPVQRTRKGAHTTTMAQLLPLDFGGWCVDTPGIKSFGVWDLNKKEIEEYYGEIHEIGINCKFPNCTHTHEHACAVKEALENNSLSPLRYASYISLLETIELEHLRR